MGEKAATQRVAGPVEARAGGNSVAVAKGVDPPNVSVKKGRCGWQEVVTNSDEVSIFEALSDERWDFSTIEGLSRTTGLTEPAVRDILSKYPSLVRRADVSDAKGRELFTVRERPVRIREKLATLQAHLADTFGFG